MTGKLNKWKLGFLFAGLCIVIILAIVLTVAGQGTYSSGSNAPVSSASGSTASNPSTSSSDKAYCVGSGYLYRTAPGINNGRDSANSEAIAGVMPIPLPLGRAVPALMASTTRTGTTILTTTAFIHMDRTTVGRSIHARTMVAAWKLFIPLTETLTNAFSRTAV